MKILHLMLACFYIDNYSYQENYLPKYHKLQGNDVKIISSLFTFDENGKGTMLKSAIKYVNEYGIPVSRLDYAPGKISHKLRKYIGLEEEIADFEPDIIFIHGVQFADINVVVNYCKVHKDVIVYADSHSDFSNSATNWLSKHILHRIIWKHYAHKISPYVKRFYGVLPARVNFLVNEYKLPKEKVSLLVMGADDEAVQNAKDDVLIKETRERIGISNGDFVIMTGGKIDQFKTQTLLLMEAVKQIQHPNVKLIVFGSVTPELKDKVSALCDGDRVKYIGWIHAKDSYNYFASADLVVFPGRHSVFWEQVAAQGIPMVVKYWDGTTHVDFNGNLRFLYKDTVEEIRDVLLDIIENNKIVDMKVVAEKASVNFMYSNIAQRSIDS